MTSLNLIYKHTCTINNKSYIGKTKREILTRLNEHIRRSKRVYIKLSHFEYALRKYGVENFTSEIIVENIPDDMINDSEKYWINFYDTFKNGYNMTEGGEGGAFFGESNGMYGTTHSDETKAKIGKAVSFANSGEKSHKTRKITIYNSEDEVMFVSTGSFRKFCKDNKLPQGKFCDSYKNNGEPIYKNINNCQKSRLVNSGMWEMKGWYAIREEN